MRGKKTVFLQDTGLCNRMPYIYVRQFKNDFALTNMKDHKEKIIQTARKNLKGSHVEK